MRIVPESIKLALQDPSLPIQKRILLYRRVWKAADSKYTLETTPVDVTDLLVEAGSIKMALDTDEVDKWDASNVTLTFNNDLNCFKEGLKGGLFEHAVLWGSKFVYNIENAGSQVPQESITVFTGYVYSSPVFRENGNQIELTITSSLDALEYVSAEDFCLPSTDELATEVESEKEDDQGKEFTTAQTGVGYVDSVKYGADLTSALTLAAGTDYEVSNTNEYSLPAKISLKFTPTAGYKMWVSYRYWHKDMKIEDIVNALLDLAGVEKRDVEPATFAGASALEYEQTEPIRLLISKDENGAFITQQGAFYNLNANYNSRLILVEKIAANTSGALHTEYPCYLPVKNSYIHVGTITNLYTYASAYPDDWASIDFLTDQGSGLRLEYRGYGRNGTKISVYPIVKYGNSDSNSVLGEAIFSAEGSCFVGFDFDKSGKLSIYTSPSNPQYNNSVVQSLGVVYKTETNFIFDGIFTKFFQNLVIHKGPSVYTPNCFFINQFAWRGHFLEEFLPGELFVSFYNRIFENKNYGRIYGNPGLVYEGLSLGENGKKWNKLEFYSSSVNSGKGQWVYQENKENFYSDEHLIAQGDSIPSSAKKIRISYKITSISGQEKLEEIKISKNISTAGIPLINLTDLTILEAVAQLSMIVSYEIGFNQDGVFFFRSRQGRYADAEINSSSLIEVDNHGADIDNLANRVSVEFGAFKTTVDDFTEGKPRPNTIDTYGVHEKSISSDNFIPADNVDVSAAVAKANYEALSTPGYTVQVDCRPDLSLELGDKITVSSENTQIADKNWSDYSKFLKLPIWKRVFKITGIELSFAKRLMSLTLKDVTSDNNVPNMEYNVYQTQFPTPLDYKE